MTLEHKLQQISDVAWLVNQGEQHVGILNKDVQSKFTYITGRNVVKFDDEFEVVEHFGNASLFTELDNREAVKQDDYYVKGYLVDYPEPFVVDEDHPAYDERLPLYTKLEGSDVLYAAGYYCIRFNKGWKYAHGPKLVTIQKYGYEGPFHTELEARQRMKFLNKQK